MPRPADRAHTWRRRRGFTCPACMGGHQGAQVMALSRFDPFADSMNLRQMMDRLFENAWVRPGPLATMGGMEGGTLALDVHETDNEVIVTTDIPGVRPEDLDVTIQGNVLRIQGEFKPREEPRASKDANETKG